MKATQRGILSVVAILAVLFAIGLILRAQTNNSLQPIPPGEIPQTATTFFRFSDYLTNGGRLGPPWPFLMDTNAPVYALNDIAYLVDDSSLTNNDALAAALALLAQPQDQFSANLMGGRLMEADSIDPNDTNSSGDGDFTNNYQAWIPTTNDLWLQIISVTNGTANLVIHPPWNVTNGVYDLYYCTNLTSPISWHWVLRSEAGQTNLTIPNGIDATGFYQIRPPDDIVANDSLGTNFWMLFPPLLSEDGNSKLSLGITSPLGSTGTVTSLGGSFSRSFTVAAGEVTNIDIDLSIMMMTNYDSVGETNSILITTTQPVSIYALDHDLYASTAFTAYPTPLPGTNYCILAYPGNPDYNWFSEFAVVATADDTTVFITPPPAVALLGGHTDTYSVVLNQGQTYQNASANWDDVTGTLITSDKPIGVFGGAIGAYVPDMDTEAGNPLVQEQLPVEDWGMQALSVGFGSRTNGDSYRVLAAYNDTTLTVTGAVVTIVSETNYEVGGPATVTITNETVTKNLMAGEFWDLIVDGPVEFQASQPIQVAHFSNGTYFDNVMDGIVVYGDPCEILLPPTGHYLQTNIVVTLPDNPKFYETRLNVIVPQSAITNTLVDASSVATTNFIPIGTSGYYGTQVTVTNSGKHTVVSSQPVGVEVYGFGIYDAYGYFGGIVQ